MTHLTDIPDFPLKEKRVHEAYGVGALGFAYISSAYTQGSILWILENWQREELNPIGFSQFSDPDKLLVARASKNEDVLAVAEESLRSGAVSLVIMEITKPLSFTAGRRLQLAAEAGKSTGLCLISDGMGTNASQTRWQCNPLFDKKDSTLQSWKLIKNKTGTLGHWKISWHAKTRRIIVVP